MWLHVSIITLTGLICASTGSHSARHQTIGWAKCLDADVVSESLRHVTFLQCLHECWVRRYCRGVNFWWRLQTCQVVHDDSGAIVHTGDGSCAFVHQTDIFNLSMVSNLFDCLFVMGFNVTFNTLYVTSSAKRDLMAEETVSSKSAVSTLLR